MEHEHGDLIRTLTGHSNSVLFAGFSPDGKLIVTGGGDNTAKIWDAQKSAWSVSRQK